MTSSPTRSTPEQASYRSCPQFKNMDTTSTPPAPSRRPDFHAYQGTVLCSEEKRRCSVGSLLGFYNLIYMAYPASRPERPEFYDVFHPRRVREAGPVQVGAAAKP